MSREASGVKPLPRLPQLPLTPFTTEEQRKAVVDFNERLTQWFEQLNGRLSLGDRLNAWSGHLDGERLVAFSAGDDGSGKGTDFPVRHNLGRIPTGYIVTMNGSDTYPLGQAAATPAATVDLIWFRSLSPVGTRYEVLVF